MRISALNSIPTVRNQQKVKNNNQNPITPQKDYREILNYPKSYRPSFGFDIFDIGFILIGLGLASLGGASAYSAVLDKKQMKDREKLVEETIKERKKDIENTSEKFNISFDEAKIYHDNYLKIAQIELKNNGNETGLNAIQGYGKEKYRLAVDFITPIVAKNNNKKLYEDVEIPNGVLLYGPEGSGKNYIAEKSCEHLENFGIRIRDVKLTESDHEKNAEIIIDAFEQAKERFDQTGKRTIINFTQDIDNILTSRKISTDALPEVSAFLSCAENCAEEGVTWIATATNPKQIDTAVLRSGRTDLKLAIGNMRDFEVADTLKYFAIKHSGGQMSTYMIDKIDFQKIIDFMQKFSPVLMPSELESIVQNAYNDSKDGRITDYDIIYKMAELCSKKSELYGKDIMTLASETMQKLEEDKEFLSEYEGDTKFLSKEKPRQCVELDVEDEVEKIIPRIYPVDKEPFEYEDEGDKWKYGF